MVLGLWLVGAVTLLMRTGVGFLATRRLRRSAAPPVDAEWVRLAVELTGQLGLTRPVRVLSSSGAAMPMTWGWWRPVVLVPTTGDWSTVRKRVVLLHELSHVARHDCVWQFVANLAVSAYWFNPLVWLAVRAQRVERERDCDDAVVRAGTPASSYADHLLEIARDHRTPHWSGIAAVAMARRSQLEGRLLSILAPGRRSQTSRGLAVAVTTAMTVAIVSLAAVTPSVRAASRGESAPVVGMAASAAYTQVAVAPVAPASEPPASSTAPREGRRQQPEPDAVQTTLERAHAELRELQRALEARTRELEMEARSQAGRQDLGVADLEALGHIRNIVAVLPLVGALGDSEPRIRRDAAEALGKFRDAGAVDGLVGALVDSDPSVARARGGSLGSDPRCRRGGGSGRVTAT